MICTIVNKAGAPRIFYDAAKRQVEIKPGCVAYADLDEGTFAKLAGRSDLVVHIANFNRGRPPPLAAQPPSLPEPTPAVPKPPLAITGHFGIGDNLHQRAIMRELMKTHEVWLHTCHFELYHDLVEQGLKLIMRQTSLHAQARTIARERDLFAKAKFPLAPPGARRLNIGYPKVLIDQHGSILEAQFSCVGLKMPERPDFSFPIKKEWADNVAEAIKQWNPGDKPLMVHRPIVVRREWDGRSRNPDPKVYDELFRAIRDRFFVVSVADLAAGREWIDGPCQQADIVLHKGELTFPQMAALFKTADLIFCNAGFAPVLAQAVGTPAVVVYGGRESYRTTQRVGAHLAPTLPIDVMNPCDCHSNSHKCDKRIDLPKAHADLERFVTEQVTQRKRNTLLFGTFYVDSPDRDNLTELWKKLHTTLNPDCDLLAVDSQSPIRKFEDWTPYDGQRHKRMYFNFPDNIGHLSRARVTQGRDGWGRAFCKGLEIACELGYEYVAHIEGDSLFRLKVSDVAAQMKAEGIDCASTSVHGMRHQESETTWIETGLMFFSTDYIKRSRFIERYDWPNRKTSPTPERYIRLWILEKDLQRDKTLRIMPWKALRADKNQITNDNVLAMNLDWVTHQHNSDQQGVYRKFVSAALGEQEVTNVVADVVPIPERTVVPVPQPQGAPLLKLNLGCGTNKLNGWENHDADVDVTKRLPWSDGVASHISIEHCIEHVHYRAAIEFFKEAYRVLAPGGTLRVTVPSLEQITKCDDAEYHKFTTKWQPLGATRRGAMHAIIYAHGHEMVWNAQLMRDLLYFAGFDSVCDCPPGQSDDPVLRGVEGHGKVIGDKFNLIESCTTEARKAGTLPAAILVGDAVAVIVGGADCWQDDLARAQRLLNGRPTQYLYINDHIKTFSGPGIACTLHPDKLNGHHAWLRTREKAGLARPDEIWSHRRHAVVTHDTGSIDWGGSSGLFAVQVALRKQLKKIIGCGIPMTVDGNHFVRHQKWQSAIAFRNGWIKHRGEIAPFFRSMSGWTKEQFGEPTEDWLNAD